MALTDRAIQTKGKPADKAFKLFDAHGLFLLVKPSGGRYWRLQYRVAGKQKLLALGVYPEVSLREARDKQTDARKLLHNGQDPAEVKRAQKRQAKTYSENSFENIAREWHSKQGRWTADHAARVLGSLKKEVFPIIGAKAIQEITPPVILEVVRKVEKRNALNVASRILQRVSSIYRYAIQTGRATYNPDADLAGSLKTRKVAHRTCYRRSTVILPP